MFNNLWCLVDRCDLMYEEPFRKVDTVEIVFRGYYLKRWLSEKLLLNNAILLNTVRIEVNYKRCSYISNLVNIFRIKKLASHLGVVTLIVEFLPDYIIH